MFCNGWKESKRACSEYWSHLSDDIHRQSESCKSLAKANRNRDSTEMRGHPNRRKVSGWSARVTSQMSRDACSRSSPARPASASLRDASPVSSGRTRAGCVFKRGKLIDRDISAASKSRSVGDKNRGGGAAVMPCESHRDPCQNLLRKNNDRQKGASSSVPSKAARGRVRPLLKTANAGLRSVSLEARSEQDGFAGCAWRDAWCGSFCSGVACWSRPASDAPLPRRSQQ